MSITKPVDFFSFQTESADIYLVKNDEWDDHVSAYWIMHDHVINVDNNNGETSVYEMSLESARKWICLEIVEDELIIEDKTETGEALLKEWHLLNTEEEQQ